MKNYVFVRFADGTSDIVPNGGWWGRSNVGGPPKVVMFNQWQKIVSNIKMIGQSVTARFSARLIS